MVNSELGFSPGESGLQTKDYTRMRTALMPEFVFA